MTDCLRRYQHAPATLVHDQGTFTRSWAPWLATGDGATARAWLLEYRDRIHARWIEAGLWRHGYWREQEVHHGTEHFELFLQLVWRQWPGDRVTVAALLDATEHLGNWAPGVPDWYDWERGVYHSMFLGSDQVGHEDGAALNMPDHFRCLNLALLAHEVCGDARYLNLATHYGRRWAQALVAGPELPQALDAAGPVYELGGEGVAQYRRFAGQAPDLGSQVNRAENLLASDAPRTLLLLGQRTGEPGFRQAAERVLGVLVTQLGDPDAGAVADAIRHYRQFTGDTRYDAAVLTAASAHDPYAARHVGVSLPEDLALSGRQPRRADGVGKRADQLCWLTDEQPRAQHPILLGLAAEITGDARLATRALDLGHATFALAMQHLPDGRAHGCSARSVSAVGRGHGRENNAGVVTALLTPLAALPW